MNPDEILYNEWMETVERQEQDSIPELSREIQLFHSDAHELEVANRDGCLFAMKVYTFGKDLYDKIEARRKSEVDPLNAQLKSINGHYKKLTNATQTLLESTKEAITEYAKSEPFEYIEGEMESATCDWVYEHKLLNIADVPREYLMLDEEKIKLLIKAGIRKINGLSIEKKEKITLRRK